MYTLAVVALNSAMYLRIYSFKGIRIHYSVGIIPLSFPRKGTIIFDILHLNYSHPADFYTQP
jgi:hypothetical protein